MSVLVVFHGVKGLRRLTWFDCRADRAQGRRFYVLKAIIRMSASVGRLAPEVLNRVTKRRKLDWPGMFHAPHVRRVLGCHLLFLSAEVAEDRVPQRKVLLAYLGDDDRDRVMQGVDAVPFPGDVVESLHAFLHRAVGQRGL